MREKKLINYIKNALKKDYLYNDEELHLMKTELKNLEEQIQVTRKTTSKGFSN